MWCIPHSFVCFQANLGNVLTPTQVKAMPKLTWEAESGALYTLILTGYWELCIRWGKFAVCL
jgi:hypothetical protein